MAGPIRKRQFPITGGGGGVMSFVHVEDAAAATAIAVGAAPGTYSSWTTSPPPAGMAAGAGEPLVPSPEAHPRWMGRLLAGEMATLMMTEVRGASNAKAKREFDWQLRYPSWRLGFAKGSADAMSGVPILEELRPRAFSVAYRMLGSVSMAEDILQEALLRLHLALEPATDRLAPGLRIDGGHPAIHRPDAIGSSPARELRGRMAAHAPGRGKPPPTPPVTPSWRTRCPWRSWCCSRA